MEYHRLLFSPENSSAASKKTMRQHKITSKLKTQNLWHPAVNDSHVLCDRMPSMQFPQGSQARSRDGTAGLELQKKRLMLTSMSLPICSYVFRASTHFGSFWFWLLMCFRLLCFLRSRPVGRFWRWVWDRRRAGRCRWRRGQSFWWSTCDHQPHGCAAVLLQVIQNDSRNGTSSYAPRSSKSPVGLVSSGCRSPNTRWRSDRRQNLSDGGRDWGHPPFDSWHPGNPACFPMELKTLSSIASNSAGLFKQGKSIQIHTNPSPSRAGFLLLANEKANHWMTQ